jgi:hypothetical protein
MIIKGFFFSYRVVEISDIMVVCALCSFRKIENGFLNVKFGVVVFV